MSNYETPGTARESSQNSSCEEDSNSNSSSNSVKAAKKEKLEEYINRFIENGKKRRAYNNLSVHRTLVAGSEWSLEHHGKHLDLNGISDL